MHYCRLAAAVLLTSILASSAPRTRAEAASPSPTSFHLLEASIDDIHQAFRSKRITCHSLVDLYLKRIQAYDKVGPSLNAIQSINAGALSEADRLDAAFRSSGLVGPLHCIPVLVKDQIETNNMPTTYGSVLFKDFIPKRNATVITNLKNAGAVILGKTTMGEFASGYLGSGFGIVRNAYDQRRYASGSSGGTGSAIAANFATVGIGEDTGGSIRGPAAVNNLVGLRPTVPLVSRFGILPARPTTDTLGPITRTVRDAAVLLDVIAGYDPHDRITAYSVGHIPASYRASLTSEGLKGARLGIIREPMDPKADSKSDDYKRFRAVTDRAIRDLKLLGAEILNPLTIPDLKDRIRKLYEGNVFETEQAIDDYFAQHANAPVKSLAEILRSGKVVPARATTLRSNLGRSTNETGYLKLLLLQEETRQLVLALMADNHLDALVYATFDQPPAFVTPDALTNPKIELQGLGNNRRLSPVLGFPAMTLPGGLTADGLPVGLEFLARPFSENTLFRLGYAYEQGTHHRRAPPSEPALRDEP